MVYFMFGTVRPSIYLKNQIFFDIFDGIRQHQASDAFSIYIINIAALQNTFLIKQLFNIPTNYRS